MPWVNVLESKYENIQAMELSVAIQILTRNFNTCAKKGHETHKFIYILSIANSFFTFKFIWSVQVGQSVRSRPICIFIEYNVQTNFDTTQTHCPKILYWAKMTSFRILDWMKIPRLAFYIVPQTKCEYFEFEKMSLFAQNSICICIYCNKNINYYNNIEYSMTVYENVIENAWKTWKHCV